MPTFPPLPPQAFVGASAAQGATFTDPSGVVLVEISFKGKRKKVKHQAATTMSELLALYEERIRAASGGILGAAWRVCDENGVEQGSEVTLGLLRDSSGQSCVRLSFEEDDWFD
ncbi:unnamed protein product [Polarella glacialis]|uniref:Uncharacterized protein n=1 Tax=Polarella glacialis TaxID=89957 RepID=A0A813EDX2_POLGL|nr:unnamed protein product [Polarella glacialis]